MTRSTPTNAQAGAPLPAPAPPASASPRSASAGRPVPESWPPTSGTGPKTSPQRRERAAAAETPGPPAAPAPPVGQEAVRARDTSPAGASLKAHGSHPAGSRVDGLPRSWVLELPPGMPLLSQNSRLHYFERNRRGQALKDAAIVLARQAKIPRLERASIVVEYQPRDRRDTDPDNVPPASGKYCIDGLVAAGVLADDNSRYVTDVRNVIGPKFPRGRLVLTITEAAGLAGIRGAGQ